MCKKKQPKMRKNADFWINVQNLKEKAKINRQQAKNFQKKAKNQRKTEIIWKHKESVIFTNIPKVQKMQKKIFKKGQKNAMLRIHEKCTNAQKK